MAYLVSLGEADSKGGDPEQSSKVNTFKN